MKIKSRPYELFGLCALLAFLISFLPTNASIDYNSHDTYFVISMRYVYRLSAAIFLFEWLLYFCFGNILLSKKLTWAHVILTILPVVVLFTAILDSSSLSGIPRRYYSFTEFENIKPWYRKGILCGILLGAIVLGQLIFLVNIVGGVVKRASKPVTTA